MKPRWRQLGLVGLVVFIFSLVVQFPAAPVVAQLRDMSGLDLQWQRVTGDIFDMTAKSLVLSLPNGRRPVVESLRLRLLPFGLLRGRLSFSVQADAWGGHVATGLSLGPQRWSLDDLQARLPLQGLYPVLPELRLTGVNGELVIRGQALAGTYTGWPDNGGLEVDVSGLTVALLAPDSPLGAYRIRLDVMEDKLVNGRFNSLQDEPLLRLNGDLRLDPGRKLLSVQGQGELATAAPDSLRDILPMFGQVSGRRIDINWQQTLFAVPR